MAGVLGIGLAGSAYGTNFSGATGGTGCSANMADNGNHFVWYNALTSATQAALNSTRTSQYNPTDLNTYNEDVLTTQTYVDAYDANYGGSTCSLTWMNGPGTQTTTNETWLACHEFGHTIGLLHTNTGVNCMQYPGIGTTTLTSHDVGHINNNY